LQLLDPHPSSPSGINSDQPRVGQWYNHFDAKKKPARGRFQVPNILVPSEAVATRDQREDGAHGPSGTWVDHPCVQARDHGLSHRATVGYNAKPAEGLNQSIKGINWPDGGSAWCRSIWNSARGELNDVAHVRGFSRRA